eukprot:GHRR01028482.1.p3 GENE.GHRR01028482.1~~GHRR01028482.1.p3  ORF type:complete len:110 (+),score=10.50 GHRR01028482.1:1129-1458(+)
MAISSSCLPCSRITPLYTTAMQFALRIVLSLCATTTLVRPAIMRSKASCTVPFINSAVSVSCMYWNVYLYVLKNHAPPSHTTCSAVDAHFHRCAMALLQPGTAKFPAGT